MAIPVNIVSGEEVYLIDSSGRKLLSFAESINILGYSNREVKNAIESQVEKLIHYTNELSIFNECVALGKRYLKEANIEGGFIFTSSGSEANEYSLAELGARRKRKIVGIKGAYHGQLYLTGAITRGKQSRLVTIVPPDSRGIETIEKLLTTSSIPLVIIIEPLMIHAGIRSLPRDFLLFLNKLSINKQAIIISDEVYLSPGKTGYFYSFQAFGINPDLFTLGKSIGGGLPLGLIAFNNANRIESPLGITTTSQGGNRVSCVAGLALLEELHKKNVIENVRKNEEKITKLLRDELLGIKGVIETRGIGYIRGVQLDTSIFRRKWRTKIILESIKNGLLISLMGKDNDVIRLAPPLVATFEDWQKAVLIIKKVIKGMLVS
uniref:Aminotransferase class III-fold pyridoxal phosphate-dependent enzyme n=1 Tax=Fervidicoccus fontis TaxID=683846 RepID=A0A7C1E247_9CREN